jgi:hypothetical protein
MFNDESIHTQPTQKNDSDNDNAQMMKEKNKIGKVNSLTLDLFENFDNSLWPISLEMALQIQEVSKDRLFSYTNAQAYSTPYLY